MSIYIEGTIIKVNPKYRSVFTIRDKNNREIRCLKHGFTAVIGLKISGYCNRNTIYKDQYDFTEQPKIMELEINKEAIIKNIKEALKGTKFGIKSAERLYNYIETYENPLTYLRKITESADSCDLLKGQLEDRQIEMLINWWKEKERTIHLQSIGIENHQFNKLNDHELNILYTNPFKIYTLDIEQCIALCQVLKIKYNEDDIKTGEIARNVVKNIRERLWTQIPIDIVYLNNINRQLEEKLATDHRIIKDNNKLLLVDIDNKERTLAQWFIQVADLKPNKWTNINRWRSNNNLLTNEQKEAIHNSLRNRCSIITGGAGTGKTTIIGEIVKILENSNISYVCTSFTGKAASRLREVLKSITMYKEQLAYTMHSLILRRKNLEKREITNVNINYFGNEDENEMNNDTINYIPEKALFPNYVIIDECSMVTGNLLFEFLNVFNDITNIILVGDPYQLEPFGNWGRPFKSLVESGKIPIYHLNTNFRTNNNNILINAQLIYHNRDNVKLHYNANFHHLNGNINLVMNIYNNLIVNGISYRNIKILVPIGELVTQINFTCQDYWSNVRGFRNKKFLLGDPVIMTKNDYKLNVMNGEEGIITSINNNKVSVKFNDQIINFNDGNILDLAYALTIHKSQGSEYDYVILYVPYLYQNVNKNLIYTAITRAKKEIWCIDGSNEIEKAVSILPFIRYEGFPEYLA